MSNQPCLIADPTLYRCPVWRERHEHSAYVFRDKLWIAGGMIPPLNSEVWSLSLPADWKP